MEAESRQTHIDALRGIAVGLMVMVHAAATWNPFLNTQATPLAYLVSGLGGLAAPLFVTLLGWGLMKSNLSLRQRWTRGLFLVACQLLVNISAPHLFDPFTPGVLSLMGLLIISEPIWSWPLRSSKYVVSTFILTAVSCFTLILLFSQAQGDGLWSTRIHSPNFEIIFKHLMLTGTYPLFPWALFAILGATISRLDSEQLRRFFAGTLTFGLVFTSLTFGWALQSNQTWALPSGNAILTFFPANAPFLIAAITGTIILWVVSRMQLGDSVLLASTGRCSLSVYVAHFIPFAAFHDIDQTLGWSLTQSALVVLAYTGGWIILGALWHTRAPKTTLESLMRSMSRGKQTRSQDESE